MLRSIRAREAAKSLPHFELFRQHSRIWDPCLKLGEAEQV